MNTVVIQVRDRAKDNVGAPMVAWALVMAVVLFMWQARYGSHDVVVWTGVGVTTLLGVYLGWHRRVGAAFFAPFVSWTVAWIPMIIGAMIRAGFVKGLLSGLFWITIGWLLLGFLEFVWLLIVASVVRLVRGTRGPSEPDVVIYGPDGGQV
jgi:hypothetical protein